MTNQEIHEEMIKNLIAKNMAIVTPDGEIKVV